MTTFKVFILLLLTGCSLFENQIQKADELLKNNKPKKALLIYEKEFLKLDSFEEKKALSKKIASLYHTKLRNPDKALYYYNFIVQNTKDLFQAQQVREKIADIYFYQKTDYKKAIYMYENLILEEKKPSYFFNLIRSYIYVEKLNQALKEIKNISKLELTPPQKWEAEYLRAEIFFESKKLSEAIEIYRGLVKKSPQWSEKQGVHLQLSLAYEQSLQYSQAISVLEALQVKKKNKEIERRIGRLKKKKQMMPRSF